MGFLPGQSLLARGERTGLARSNSAVAAARDVEAEACAAPNA